VRFAAKSISAKITWMNMLVSGAALLLAASAFFAYDQFTFRQGLVHALSAQAQIIASNSVSALVFNDPQAAENTLAALKSSPNIESAGIFRPNRAPFAEYLRSGGTAPLNIPALPNTQQETYQFRSTHLVLVEPINFQGQFLGFVYVRSDLRELDKRLKRYGVITLVVLFLSLDITNDAAAIGLADREYSITGLPMKISIRSAFRLDPLRARRFDLFD